MSFADVPNRKEYSLKTTIYNRFRGVDFSTDPSLVDSFRSPYAVNIISDTGGMPEKRLGWRKIYTVEAPVNGIFYTKINGVSYTIVHGGTKLYKVVNNTPQIIKSGVNNGKSSAFYLPGLIDQSGKDKYYDDSQDGIDRSGLYILTGREFLWFNGEKVIDATEDPYVPNVLAACDPQGAGAVIEPVNLLTEKRMQSFIGTETDRVYHLYAKEILSVDKVEISTEDGGKETLSESKNEYSANLKEGTVTLSAPRNRLVAGKDNIFITFSKENEKNPEMIKKCTIGAVYGINKNDKMFISGNPDYNGRIWHSYSGRPNYFPDTSYIIAGSEENKVMGFTRLGRYLIVIKEDNQQDSTIFQILGEASETGVNYYIEQGIAGVGAISPYSFSILLDEPLFLSKEGIMAIHSNYITLERTIKNRSYFIDTMLLKEENLENACGVEWNGYHLISVNNNCYVLDSRNKAFLNNQTLDSNDFVYECYFWDNFPARCFHTLKNELYFGTENGWVCKLNTDILTNKCYNDEDEPIVAIWSTKDDDDDLRHMEKTLSKKGCTVTVKPFSRSSAKIYYKVDGNSRKLIANHEMDIFDWINFDFERFTFNTDESPQEVYLKHKVKKYKRLQLIIENGEPSEGFGILKITKTYRIGRYAKR